MEKNEAGCYPTLNRMPNPKKTTRSPFNSYIAPLAMGAGYAVSKVLMVRWLEPERVAQVDFKLYVLAGFFLGIVLRPIVQRIYWYRRTSFVVLTLMLLLMGPAGAFPESFMGNQPIDGEFWQRILPEVASVLMVTLLASLILVPAQFQLTLADIFKRLLYQISWDWGARVVLGAAVYVGLFLCFRVALISVGTWEAPWHNVLVFFKSAETSWLEKVGYLWGRGVMLVLALLPIHNILRGKPYEMALIFGAVLFVVGDFAPLVASTSGGFGAEMIDQIVQRLFIDFIFCYAVMLLFDKFPFFLIREKTNR